jgi:uncharacterized protein with PQ loop repeat
MTMLPADAACVEKQDRAAPATSLEKVLRGMSVFTMLMTIPQVYIVWVRHDVAGVSLLSWLAYLISAVLWFVYGWQKGDKTIYMACIGWVLLDLAIVVGVLVQ